MELDSTHTQKTVIQHHETGPDMEPSGERKRGRPRSGWRRDTLAELQRVGMTKRRQKGLSRAESDGGVSSMAYDQPRAKRGITQGHNSMLNSDPSSFRVEYISVGFNCKNMQREARNKGMDTRKLNPCSNVKLSQWGHNLKEGSKFYPS